MTRAVTCTVTRTVACAVTCTVTRTVGGANTTVSNRFGESS
jgi:hypothetical protein